MIVRLNPFILGSQRLFFVGYLKFITRNTSITVSKVSMLEKEQKLSYSNSSSSSSKEEDSLIWTGMLSILKHTLSDKEYSDWIEPLILEKITEKQIVILVPNMVFYHSLLSKFSQQLELAKDKVGQSHLSLHFTPIDEKNSSKIKDLKHKKNSGLTLATLFGDNDLDIPSCATSSNQKVSSINTGDLGTITKTNDEFSLKQNSSIDIETNFSSIDSSINNKLASSKIIKENSQLSVSEIALSKLETSIVAPTNNSGLNSNYTFDSFVVGESNMFAHSSCASVASAPGTAYNPLFIYGSTGLGKTHLLHAVGNYIIKHNPSLKITYISSERFTNEMVSCLRYDNMSNFRKKYRGCDVLLIDDIQFISGKDRTQEEFFHTFNTLYENHKQIVVTSDMYPQSIPDIEERLRNRFQWGLIADIRPPSFEHRLEILRKKVSILKLKVSDDVLDYIATQTKKNIRELEGALHKLAAFAGLHGRSISLDLAYEIFQHNPKDETSNSLSIELVQKAVAEHYNVRVLDLRSQKRIKTLVLPRQVAFYLCRKKLDISFPEIGAKFGGRDHSTVIHGYKKIEKDIDSDFELKNAIDLIERKLDLYE